MQNLLVGAHILGLNAATVAERIALAEAVGVQCVVHGSAQQVKERLRTLPSFGCNELLGMVIMAKGDASAFERTIQVLGELAKE